MQHYLPSGEIDKLRAMLQTLPKSQWVLPLNCEIPGHPSFFPGGRGYKGPAFPQSPVMFLGHSFDTCCGFYRSVRRGTEDDPKIKTWANIRKYFLPTADLKEEECFFTNFYLGAIIPEPIEETKKKKTNKEKFECPKNTGAFPGSKSYRDGCIEALRTQVEIVRPRVIALLGRHVPPRFLEAYPKFVEAFPDDTSFWSSGNLADIQLKQPLSGYRLELPNDLQVQVICLVHPSNPRSNKSHCYQGSILGSAVNASRE